jgi:hypothetical protein
MTDIQTWHLGICYCAAGQRERAGVTDDDRHDDVF